MNDAAISFRYPSEAGKVSVIIPTYNRASIVGRAIGSALGQTYSNLEIVVIDDGSVDDTESVVRQFDHRIRLFRQQNAGVAAARNAGLAQAKGEFIAFLDSDDAWRDWKLEAQMAGFRAHPEVGLVCTDMSAINATGDILDERYLRKGYHAYQDIDIESVLPRVGTLGGLLPSAPDALRAAPVRVGEISNEILLGNLLHTSTVVVRRQWVAAVGGFRSDWRTGEDYEYYTRLCTSGSVMLIDAPSSLYRIGAEDQLTAPDKLVHVAQNNLRTVRARLADRAGRIKLPRAVLRRRLARSLEWVGSAEFEAGHRAEAARHLAASLRVRPRVDRRVLLLLSCALPQTAVQFLRAMRRRWRLGGQHGVAAA